MKLTRSIRLLQAANRFHTSRIPTTALIPSIRACRRFHASPIAQKLQTHVLSDIGEGVKEVQIIQWFVEEGAAVEEWAPLCEVQSDKASVEITSKYTGVIKKIHFDRDAIVQVGDSMLDIDVDGDAESEENVTDNTEGSKADEVSLQEQSAEDSTQKPPGSDGLEDKTMESPEEPSESSGTQAGLATPAVRGLLKEHGLEIGDIQGTGKEGRVLKEDIQRYLETGKSSKEIPSTQPTLLAPRPELDAKQVETVQNLTPVQSAMYKTMTKSLSIPHFLFSDSINITSLAAMRASLNTSRDPESLPKLSYLPFVIKAVSLALNRYPSLNARLDTSDSNKPKLQLRSNHNIGVAMDTTAGLLVPVIKNVNARSIVSIAQELRRLSQLGKTGKLPNNDLTGGTITVSNIGSIGGEVVAPVIVEGQLAILGLGKIKATPVFAADGKSVERADLMSASWSADHRVIDGATMARMARLVQEYLEKPEKMMIDMS